MEFAIHRCFFFVGLVLVFVSWFCSGWSRGLGFAISRRKTKMVLVFGVCDPSTFFFGVVLAFVSHRVHLVQLEAGKDVEAEDVEVLGVQVRPDPPKNLKLSKSGPAEHVTHRCCLNQTCINQINKKQTYKFGLMRCLFPLWLTTLDLYVCFHYYLHSNALLKLFHAQGYKK